MSKDVKFNIRLSIDGKEQIVTAQTNVKKLAEELELARTKATATRESLLKFTQISASIQNVITGMQQLTGVLRSYSEANAVQVEAETKLATVMRQRMGATDAEVQSIKELASAQQELGIIGDEVQLSGAQQIATFLNEKASLETLIPAMNNLLAQQKGFNATVQDAVSVGNLMGKVMQGQTSALTRVGITFSEAEEKVLKFGTEQERAAMLAKVITNNVGEMNAQLAKTDPGQAKQLANTIGDMKEQVGALYASVEPAIVAAGELGLAFMAVGTTYNGVKGLCVGVKNLTSIVKLSTVTTVAHTAATKVSTAIQALWTKQLYYGRAASIAWTFGAKMATVQAIAMRGAIIGLMAVTGVGLAIAAVSAIVSIFAGKTDDATGSIKKNTRELRNLEESAKRAKDVEQATSDAYTKASSVLEVNKSKLKGLIDAKSSGKNVSAEEKKIVGELNDTYGDTMGYFGSVSEWYNALIKNSEDYCRQMVLEAKIRTLANQIAQKESETRSLIYDDKGNKKKYSTERLQEWVVTGYTANGYQTGEFHEIVGSSELEKVTQQVKDNQAVVADLQKQLHDAVKEAGDLDFAVKGAVKRPVDTGDKDDAGKSLELIENAKTYKELANNVSYYQQELENADITDTNRILTLARAKKSAEDAVASFKDMAEASVMSDGLNTIDDYDKKLQRLRQTRRTATAEAIAGIDEEIRQTEVAKQALEDKGIAALNDKEIKTYDQLNAKLAYYNRLLNSGDEQQRQFAQNGINFLNKLKEAWKSDSEAMGELPETFATIKDIDSAISFYTERQQKEDADQIQKTQEVINSLINKKATLQIGIDLTQMQDEASKIEDLTGKERKIVIKGIGFDELTNKIKKLNSLLSDTGNPVTGNQRRDIEDLIGVYEKWRKESISSFDTFKEGWSGIEGISGGVEDLTEAIEGNGSAWEKVSGIVNAFIKLYEGMQAVIGIINMLTQASQSHTAAKQSEAIATTAATTATVTGAAQEMAVTQGVIASRGAETNANISAATSGALKAYSGIPFVGIALGLAAVASIIAVMKSLPKFAKGGIVSGPTIAMVGEYGGATNNPEVIAPLDKLRSMLVEPGADIGSRMEFKIKGRTLVALLEKENNLKNRS